MQYETSSGDCVIGAITDPRQPTTCLTKSVAFATNDDPGKQCVFPFTHNGNTYNECRYDPNDAIPDVHPICGTATDGTTVLNKVKGVNNNGTILVIFQTTYGFCNTACPGGLFVGPSDVGGVCPPGVQTKMINNVDNCCCGSSSCCWLSCTDNDPPQDCLPTGAEWKLNANRQVYEAVQLQSTPTAVSSGSYQSQ